MRFLLRAFKRKTWALILVITGAVLILALSFALAFRATITVDLGMALLGLALLAVAIVFGMAVRYWLRPENLVSINYNVKLAAPAMPLGRYSFRMEVFYEVEEKGKREVSQQGLVELKFRKKEHPDMYSWCCQQISSQLSQHRVRAAAAYPEARIVAGPDPTPNQLEQRLVVTPPLADPPLIEGS